MRQPLVTSDDSVLVSAGYGLGSALLRIAQGSDGVFSVEEVWSEGNLKKLRSKFADMILLDGFVYSLDDGILACLEAETGKRRWKQGRFGHGQLLLVGDLLLVLSETGELALIEPNPKSFNELGRITVLHAKTWNTPAISGRKLLVRNHEEAACYELPLEQAAGSSRQAAEGTGQ